MHPTNERLRVFLVEQRLTLQQAADLIGVSRETARNWTRNPSTANYRKMPLPAMELLEWKAKAKPRTS